MNDHLSGVVVHSSKVRSIAKAASYRTLAVIVDLSVIYLITRRAELAIGIAAATNVGSAILYYLHERFWNRVGWGTHAHRVPDPNGSEPTPEF